MKFHSDFLYTTISRVEAPLPWLDLGKNAYDTMEYLYETYFEHSEYGYTQFEFVFDDGTAFLMEIVTSVDEYDFYSRDLVITEIPIEKIKKAQTTFRNWLPLSAPFAGLDKYYVTA